MYHLLRLLVVARQSQGVLGDTIEKSDNIEQFFIRVNVWEEHLREAARFKVFKGLFCTTLLLGNRLKKHPSSTAGSHFCYLYMFPCRSDCITLCFEPADLNSGMAVSSQSAAYAPSVTEPLVSLSRLVLDLRCVGIIRSGLPPIFGFARRITPSSRMLFTGYIP